MADPKSPAPPQSYRSIHSMDDDINGLAMKNKKSSSSGGAKNEKSGSVIRLHEKATQLCDDVKATCCVLF